MIDQVKTKKKKLLVTGSTFPRWEGDTEPRFVLDLSEALEQYFDVTVLVPAAPGVKDTEIMNGVNVIRYHYFPIHKWETLCYPGAIVPRIKERKIRGLLVPFLFLSLYFHLWKMLPKFDVVQAHWIIPQGIVQSFFKKPYIVTGHGGDVTSLNKGILRNMKVRCLKKARYVTVVSKHLKNELLKLADLQNIDVISMGCKTENFGKRYAIQDYFEQGDKAVVLFVGRLAEKKGVTYLIQAMKQVDAKLVIVGDGPLRTQLENQAIEQGNKIVFLGARTHDELKTIYASSDVFVAPSVTAKDGDMEGVPTAIMEAMASEIPIVASASGGIKELIQHGKNGLLTQEANANDIAEKINWLLTNKVEMEKIKNRALNTVKEKDYRRLAERYAKILGEIE